MYKKRLVFLIIGFTISFLVFGVFGSKYLRDNLILSILVIGTYLLYIFYDLYREYKVYKLDKHQGVQIDELEFISIYIFKPTGRSGYRDQPIATFRIIKNNDEEDKMEFIKLSGDFSKAKLVEGAKYRVSYYEHTQVMVNIEKI